MQRLYGLQYFIAMPFRVDLWPDFTNNTIFIDEEGLAVDAHVFLTVHVLLFPYAIHLRNSCIRISQQRKGQTVFVG